MSDTRPDTLEQHLELLFEGVLEQIAELTQDFAAYCWVSDGKWVARITVVVEDSE